MASQHPVPRLTPEARLPELGAEGFATVTETHIGIVFFVGDRAVKMKKPVSMGFLDFTHREQRLAACTREVELNRRLAPDVYLGVADVLGPDGEPCEHLVVMRRLPSERRLSNLATGANPVDHHLRRLASLLADFHSRAIRSADITAAAEPEAVLARWEANARHMEPLVGPIFEAAAAEHLMRLARRFVAGRIPLFTARIAQGHICDGHGDLLADDIFCLDDGPRVLDCLEFDDQLRYGDLLNDVAFLAMDLERLGRPDLAQSFLAHYREFSQTSWPPSLEHHYIAYRAQVRALVSGLRVGQGAVEAAEPARNLLDLAISHLERGRVQLVAVGGLPATGKSTLAAGLGQQLGGLVLRSDEVRKELAGLSPTTRASAGFGEDLYSPQMTAATYSALLDRAEQQLGLGVSVVLDATFSDPRWREAVRSLASATSADLCELRLVAPPDVLEERLARRTVQGTDVSDATVAVERELARHDVVWPSAHLVDTTPEPAVVLARALACLATPDPP